MVNFNSNFCGHQKWRVSLKRGTFGGARQACEPDPCPTTLAVNASVGGVWGNTYPRADIATGASRPTNETGVADCNLANADYTGDVEAPPGGGETRCVRLCSDFLRIGDNPFSPS